MNVAGTSAGAITALALSLGTEVQELVDIIGNTDFKSFLDTKAYEIVSNISSETASAPAKTSAAVNSLPLLTNSFGLAAGKGVLDYLEAFVKERTKISYLTFGELHKLVEEDRELVKQKFRSKRIRKDLFVGRKIIFHFENEEMLIIINVTL
jgi:predicted acylesterase/phospholipase RssA